MAIIGSIRKRSGLLLVIVGIALAAFVLGDFLAAGPRRQEFNIGVVEGTKIPILAFNQRLEENLLFRRQSLGRENLTPQEQFDVRQTTWDDMVREILMEKQYSKLGLSVSTEELDELIRGDNPHSFIRQSFTDPQTGEFNPETVNEFLRNLNQVEASMRQRYLFIEKAVKDDRLQTKYRNLISKGFNVPAPLAVFDHNSKNDVANVVTVALRYTTIADDAVEISEADLRSFYEANNYRFRQEESRSIEFVLFEILPSDEDRQKTEEEINRLHKEFAQATNPALFVNAHSDARYDSTWFAQGMLPLNIEELLFDAPVGTTTRPIFEDNTYKVSRLVDVQHRPDSMR
ncbi:MAG TPA: SurA N-terminal domain-containing protein, partial [Bacteroidales bacterium]|nr:SurA N-terminal domain-containing protein [Bacteroidales bacterium]